MKPNTDGHMSERTSTCFYVTPSKANSSVLHFLHPDANHMWICSGRRIFCSSSASRWSIQGQTNCFLWTLLFRWWAEKMCLLAVGLFQHEAADMKGCSSCLSSAAGQQSAPMKREWTRRKTSSIQTQLHTIITPADWLQRGWKQQTPWHPSIPLRMIIAFLLSLHLQAN